jgi:hypothetical protein
MVTNRVWAAGTANAARNSRNTGSRPTSPEITGIIPELRLDSAVLRSSKKISTRLRSTIMTIPTLIHLANNGE